METNEIINVLEVNLIDLNTIIDANGLIVNIFENQLHEDYNKLLCDNKKVFYERSSFIYILRNLCEKYKEVSKNSQKQVELYYRN